MSKIIRTNERCYICDFGRAVEDNPDHQQAKEVLPSLYLDSLSNGQPDDESNLHPEFRPYHRYQDPTGRYVFVDPRDGRPICTQCAEEVRATVEEMELRDRNWEPLTWHQEAEEAWRDILRNRGPVLAEEVDWPLVETVTFEIDEDTSGDYNEPGPPIVGSSELERAAQNIDWDRVEYWDNGSVKFPLPQKNPVKPLGQRLHTNPRERQLTDDERRQVEYMLHVKGNK